MKTLLVCLTILCAGCVEITQPELAFANGCVFTDTVRNADGSVALILEVTELRPAACDTLAAEHPGAVLPR